MGQVGPDGKKMVSVDVNDFVRTRDALSSSYISLSSAIDKAVKAYIDHTNVVLAGDASLDVSFLTQPFTQLANLPNQQIAQFALHHTASAQHAPMQNGAAAATTPAGELVLDGKKKKRAYKARDPNAPKRPLTAYFRFLQEQRGPLAEQMAKDPDTPHKPGDLSKVATEMWNKLTETQKEPYKAAYQRALKDYDRQVATFKGQTTKTEELAGTDSAEVPQADSAAERDDEDEDDDDDTTSSSDDDTVDEDEAMHPPPPPKASGPTTTKKTPKSALKKSKQYSLPPTPQFSSLNAAPVPTSSPDKKRKALSSDAAELETGKKKRGRNSNAEKEARTAAAAANVAPMAMMAEPEGSPAGLVEKVKKEKKKKRRSEA